ncbi:hypothetical protein A5634_23270 [Mycobacterium asiaticum]|uniref:AIM24 family protein n=1 Tax=Mycobacterium asiaticum TaxID=1790 RepID=A0A1A3NZK4_MYCAS|nr:AIM24 family protein [Mycobacterium asiaticum]OBK27428.1 hypothetical protein A5634_23270 [Mycobacterium asiaticum]
MAQLYQQHKKVIEAHLTGDSIKALTGAMVAYEGNINFKNAGFGGGSGMLAGLKQRVTGEALSLMECTGHGKIYLAVNAQNVTIIDINNEQLQVESRQLLALSGKLQTNVTFTGLRGAASGGQGLFTTVVSGYGQVALLSAGGPLIHLEVSPQYPLVVDPDAFVCAKGQMQQSFITDISWRSAIGQGSGEAFSLKWEGQGLVSIQPAER